MNSVTVRLATFILLLCAVFPAGAQHFVPVDKGSKVEFTVKSSRAGADIVKGTIGNLSGNITFDPQHLENASFDIAINTATIHTGNTARDNDLKKDLFFNAAHFPEIRIKSTSVTIDRPGGIIYVLHGILTIKGISKPVNIQFMATPVGNGYLFRGSFQLNRLIYNIGEKGDIDDNVSIFIEVKAVRK